MCGRLQEWEVVVGVVGEGEGVGDSVLALIEEWRWRKGGSSTMLMLGETMVVGKLNSKWGTMKRGSGAVWRRRGARCTFYWVDEGERGRCRGGSRGRNR
jgi:hypothetical protein